MAMLKRGLLWISVWCWPVALDLLSTSENRPAHEFCGESSVLGMSTWRNPI
jgi:hypothetical protein